MRRVFTVSEARARGITPSALRWGAQTGRWSLVERGVYVVGSDPPNSVERAVGAVLATGGAASGTLAGLLLDFDAVDRASGAYVTVPRTGDGRRPEVRRKTLAAERIITVQGFRCTDGLQTLVDLSATVDDLLWEQILESALRKQLTTIEAVANAATDMARSRTPGTQRIRRVLALRPQGAPPTESLLETLMVQLAREIPGLDPPTRQVVVLDRHGGFVARVDLAWPELGLFIELDGQQHKGQPVYDASRETAVVAATGWLVGRFTWTEVVHLGQHTIRRLAALVAQARRRPLPA